MPDSVSRETACGSGGACRRRVLTGRSGEGKSTLCRELVAGARARDLCVRGLLTVLGSDVEGNLRWAEDLGTGERRLLARELASDEFGSDGLRWEISDDTLAWGDGILASACPADVLIVDEAGPVELLYGRGWRRGMEAALAGRYGLAVVVVRSGLLAEFAAMVDDSSWETLDVDARERLFEEIDDLAASSRRAKP